MFLYICEYLKVEPAFFFKNEEIENDYEQVIKKLSAQQKKELAKFILSLK